MRDGRAGPREGGDLRARAWAPRAGSGRAVAWTRRLLRRAGVDVVRYRPGSPAFARRVALARERGVDAVVDVGASVGDFALELRRAGFRGRILSCEPLAGPFERLQAACAHDPGWSCLQVALGASRRRAPINVAANWASSSLLPMEPRHVRAEPRSSYVGVEECDVVTLDDVAARWLRPDDRLYVKLDVQGSELAVLEGASATLPLVHVLDVEMSLLPLYTGAPLLDAVVGALDGEGFALVQLEPSWVARGSGAILQVDGLFTRVDTG